MITDFYISPEACAAIKYVRSTPHTLDKQQMASMKGKQIVADKGKEKKRQFKLPSSNCCSIYFLYKQFNETTEETPTELANVSSAD